MAEESSVPSFYGYHRHPHVSQQTRRDKLRFLSPAAISDDDRRARNSASSSPPCHRLFTHPSSVVHDASPSHPQPPHPMICQPTLPRRRDCVEIREIGRPVEARSSVPLGPFIGYASVLKRSRFLKAAEQVLEEFCGVDRRGKAAQEGKRCFSSYLMDLSLDNLRNSSPKESPVDFSDVGIEHRFKNLRLVFLLEEVYKRYKLYFQQMQSVVVSFEAVSGLENAAPYVIFAFKAMWKHFKCLKVAILDQIHIMDKSSIDNGVGQDSTLGLWTADQGFQGDKSVQNPILSQHTVCRSRSNGLPDYAVVVLRSWMFEHFLHPYPTDLDKQMLAQQTGLSKTQVTNWFINARVRLWKPMVVEELRARSHLESDDQNGTNLQIDQHIPFTDLPPLDKQFPTTLAQRTPGVQTKRRREEYTHVPNEHGDKMNSSWSDLSSSRDRVVWSRAVQSGVSLALGLNQNNGIQMSGPSQGTRH